MTDINLAVVTGLDVDSNEEAKDLIERFLPHNYQVFASVFRFASGKYQVVIAGVDHAGWTYKGYVEPRLASGLYFARPISFDDITYELGREIRLHFAKEVNA